MSIEQIRGSPHYKLVSLQRELNGDGNAIKWIFTTRHPCLEEPFFSLQSGELLLDADRYYCPIETKAISHYIRGVNKQTSEFVYHNRYEYTSSKYGVPLPKLFVGTTKVGPNPVLLNSRADYTFQFPWSIPNAEFRLSHYNLPEPQLPRRPFAWTPWLVVMSIVLIALGVILRSRGAKAP